MLRQRQLALERQKRANKNALGPSVIAQAHDLPVLGSANLLPKAAGWSQLLDLGPTVEKPPVLHQEPKKMLGAGIANKSRTPLGGAGATIISTTCTTATARGVQTADVWDKQSAVESALLDMNAVQPIEELNLAGVQETVAQDNIGLEEPLPERKKEMAGWNLEIEEVRGGRAAPDMDAEADNGGGKRWFRPWKKQPTGKKEDTPQVPEATSICNFESDIREVPSRGNDDGRASSLSGWDSRTNKTVAASTSATHAARRQVNEQSTVMSMSPRGQGNGSGGEEERSFKRPPRRVEPALPGGIDYDDGIEEAIASMN
jgi:hypothetical protein